jgi:hypothetical protein
MLGKVNATHVPLRSVQDGVSLPIIGAMLDRANSSTTAVYARFSQDVKRTAIGPRRQVDVGGERHSRITARRLRELECCA